MKYLKKRVSLLFCLLCLLFGTKLAFAQQAGTLDTSFNPTDTGNGTGVGAGGTPNLVQVVSVQADDKIIIGGNFSSYNATYSRLISRLTADGKRDPSFNIGTGVEGPPGIRVYTVAVQPDGKVLIGGWFLSFNGNINAQSLTRLNSDGSVDSFFLATGTTQTITKILLQPDGKILVSGSFNNFNNTAVNSICRLNSDGTLDLSFNSVTGANGVIEAMALQADGKIIIGGSFSLYNGFPAEGIARLNTDGSLDSAFNAGTGPSGVTSATVHSLAVQSDGKIVVGGNFTSFDSSPANHLVRLTLTGTVDASFISGAGPNERVRSITQQPDAKLIVAGDFTAFNGSTRKYVVRLNSNGSPDPGFDQNAGPNTGVFSTGLQSDGKIIITGDFNFVSGTGRNGVARLAANGEHDLTFNRGTGANGKILATVLKPDGGFLIGGNFTTYNGLARNGLACLTTTGELDPGFNSGTGAPDVRCIALQPDGKILIGGSFTSYNGIACEHIARLYPDGTFDSSFSIPTVVSATFTVNALLVQPDGKIVVGMNDGVLNNQIIARLNTDGTVDNSFSPDLPWDGSIDALALQPDGKIVLGGTFGSGTGLGTCVRLFANGSTDIGYQVPDIPRVFSLAIQPDGKLLVGTWNTGHIYRYNTDGTSDASFAISSPIGSYYAIAVQPDGKIVAGGDFGKRITRLLPDGTIDPDFQSGTGAGNVVYAIALQPDGKIVIGGNFTSYNGTGRNRITRLHGGVISATPDLDVSLFRLYPNPASGYLTLELPQANNVEDVQVEVYNSLSQKVLQKQVSGATVILKLHGLSPGMHMVRVQAGEQILTRQVVLQ